MYTYNAKIIRVVDGDTVVLDIDLGFHTWKRGEHVRLLGIDTPEIRGVSDEEKVRGRAAKAFVEDLVEQCAYDCQVVVETKTPRDKYGRYLANIIFVQADGKTVNLTSELITAGFEK